MNAPAKTEEFAVKIPDGVYAEKVLSVTHYTDELFRFRMTRPAGFRFRSGEFAMIGLMVGEKPVYRAYSIASPSWDEELEFFSIKVPDGPLTSHLQLIKPGDTVLMRKKPTGTLVLDALTPGRRLYMLSTGTGVAPFASLIRDPETYEKFEEVILTHTCRTVAELKYGFDLVEEIRNDETLNEIVGDKLKHYATVTREDYPLQGRITDLIENGKLFSDLGVPPFDPEIDRGMICGSSAMLKDTKQLLEKAGLNEGANNKPAEFVIERAFVG
jgi:ferredoxin--NADP+ reductase